MKKQIFLGAALLLLTASCSNNDTTSEDEKGKVNVAQAVDFAVDFADYNAEQEVGVTRAQQANKEEKIEQQKIDLGNGILAICTLQRDTNKQTKPAATRALPNETYTMMAYDAATKTFKGAMTGTVSGGAFTAADAQKRIILEPGTYDFVLFNSKVSRNGNNLTVARADAGAAMIGRTENVTITPTPKKQQVAFTLKHVGAKVKVKLTGFMNFTGVAATIASVNATDVPGSSTYDAANGTWTTSAGEAMTENLTYAASQAVPGAANAGKYAASSNEEAMFTVGTDVSKLKLNFTAGSIYNMNMAGASFTFNPATALTLEPNGAYVLSVKLMYKFLYLMADGSTGFIEETTYGGAPAATAKTPIGVVLSRSRRMAIALENAAGGAFCLWATMYYYGIHTNTNEQGIGPGLYNLENGYAETWDPNCTTASVTGEKVKAKRPDFPAFKAAGEYTPTLPTGVNLTNGMENKKWYLPAYGEWKYAFMALGFGTPHEYGWIYWVTLPWYGTLADTAFTQVGGTRITTGKSYWASSEVNSKYAGQLLPGLTNMRFWHCVKPEVDLYVRPFIRY